MSCLPPLRALRQPAVTLVLCRCWGCWNLLAQLPAARDEEEEEEEEEEGVVVVTGELDLLGRVHGVTALAAKLQVRRAPT